MPKSRRAFDRDVLSLFQSDITPILDRALGFLFGFLILFSILFIQDVNNRFFGYMDLGFAVLCGITLLFRRRISVPVKILIMMAFGGILAILGLSRVGFLGNAVPILMLMIVVSEILLRPRTTSLIGSLSVGLILVIGSLARYQVLVYDPILFNRMTQWRFWLLQAIQLALFFLVSFYLVYYMRSRLLDQILQLTDAKSTVERIAFYDSLTGLLNRTRFRMDVAARMAGQDVSGSIVLLNIKGFRIVNSLAGQEKGDQLLKAFSDILQECWDEESIIARQGADEFAVWIEGMDEEALNSTVREMQSIARIRISGEEYGHKLEIYCSAAEFPIQGRSFEDCLRNASLAMRTGKEAGVTDLIRFDSAIADRIESETRMRMLLERDIRSRQFEIHYQKKINLQTGLTTGVEALARWYPDELGMVSPDIFIPVIGKAEMVIPFGKIILDKIIEDLPGIQREYGPEITVSINVSPLFFLHPGFRDYVLTAVREAGINPSVIVFEVTEDVFIDDLDTVRELCALLEEDGFSISMDDFGKGYSSLYYISNIPFSELKVDKSFIDSICTDERSFELLKSICGIARTFGIKVVAEGVESEDQIRRLKETTCDIVQGYYYSRPEGLNHRLDDTRRNESPLTK